MTSRNREKKRARALARFDKRCRYEAQLVLFGWEPVKSGDTQGVRHIATGQVAFRRSDGCHFYDRTGDGCAWRPVPFAKLTAGFLWTLVDWLNRKQRWHGVEDET